MNDRVRFTKNLIPIIPFSQSVVQNCDWSLTQNNNDDEEDESSDSTADEDENCETDMDELFN